jgi:phycocyanobilin:ferredoxin oxidoreductase
MHMWLILSVHSPDTHHHPAAMQVIHCVMYPRTEYDLPILSFDMVGNNGRVSLVCIDPCPVAADRSLPPIYVSLVR